VPQPIGEDSRILLAMLADGQWRSLDEIRQKLATHVAPGRALRAYQVKEDHRVSKAGPRHHEELPVHEKIRSGRSTLVSHAIHSMASRHIEFEDRGVLNGGRWTRIRPGMLDAVRGAEPVAAVQPESRDPPPPPPPCTPVCPQCGLYIVNTAQHDEFHQRQGGPPVAAFFCEDEIRDLIAVEVARALDGFVVGLRHYLDAQFADLQRRTRHRTRGDTRLPDTLQR
jgi:hypothetical protein